MLAAASAAAAASRSTLASTARCWASSSAVRDAARASPPRRHEPLPPNRSPVAVTTVSVGSANTSSKATDHSASASSAPSSMRTTAPVSPGTRLLTQSARMRVPAGGVTARGARAVAPATTTIARASPAASRVSATCGSGSVDDHRAERITEHRAHRRLGARLDLEVVDQRADHPGQAVECGGP